MFPIFDSYFIMEVDSYILQIWRQVRRDILPRRPGKTTLRCSCNYTIILQKIFITCIYHSHVQRIQQQVYINNTAMLVKIYFFWLNNTQMYTCMWLSFTNNSLEFIPVPEVLFINLVQRLNYKSSCESSLLPSYYAKCRRPMPFRTILS